MKKLLLAAVVMLGVSSLTYAQSPEAVKAKKEAAKKGTTAPAFTTSDAKMATDKQVDGKVKSQVATTKTETDLDKTPPSEDVKAAENMKTEVKLVKHAKKTEAKAGAPKTEAKPAVKKTADN